MLFNRFSIVPELSSAARIPFPGATNFLATDSRLSVFINFSSTLRTDYCLLPRKMFAEMQTKTGGCSVRCLSENIGRATLRGEDSARYNAPETQGQEHD